MTKKDQMINNWSYLLWFLFYFTMTVLFIKIFTTTIIALLISAIAYAITLSIAFSSVGEQLIRDRYHFKNIITFKDMEILPLFENVYEEAKEYCPYLSNDIKLYIVEDLSINAYAVGRNTIAITTGTVHALNDDGISALLAHELGHMAYGDTKASLLNTVGNGFFAIYFMICNFVIGAFFGMAGYCEKSNPIFLALLKLIAFLLKGLVSIFIIIGNLLLSANSQAAEFQADDFAYNIGYGNFLVNTLYLINQAFPEVITDISSLDYRPHPDIKERIAKLEAKIIY